MRNLSTLAAGFEAIAPIISFLQAGVNWLRRSRPHLDDTLMVVVPQGVV